MNTPCPCGRPLEFEQCCAQYIEGKTSPATPEDLMRSRYSAYATANVSYLQSTMIGAPLADFDANDTLTWLKEVSWKGLKVINTKMKSDKLGFVSFEARYDYHGNSQAICEKSEFHLIDNKWVYVGGKTLNPNKKW